MVEAGAVASRPAKPAVSDAGATTGPLADVRVLDCSTVIAGPSCAKYFADFGADVIKIERPPDGDSTRRMGLPDPTDGTSLAWKLFNRGKRVISLDLRSPAGRDAVLRLVEHSDVLVENLRPGKFDALGLDAETLWRHNPKLVITRISGFGQTGPYAYRPGFASIAEAMAGWAALAGEPDGPPMLPPVALTDELTGLSAAFATMVALHSGVGQVVDANLVESLLQVLGAIVPAYFASGFLQGRMGSSLPNSVPRGVWRAADGVWVALSTSSDAVAARVMRLIGFGDDPGVVTVAGRAERREAIDTALTDFVGSMPAAEVVRRFDEADAAAAIVLDIAGIAADPHFAARGSLVDVDGVRMQNLLARLSATPGKVRWSGRAYDADTAEVLAEFGIDVPPAT